MLFFPKNAFCFHSNISSYNTWVWLWHINIHPWNILLTSAPIYRHDLYTSTSP